MMIKNICFFLLKILLFYSVVFIELRNFLFDLGLLRSKSFSKKIISIGNLSMGGAGKTPVEEYIIKLLSKKYKVALLCRGYKSKNSVVTYSFRNVWIYRSNEYCSKYDNYHTN